MKFLTMPRQRWVKQLVSYVFSLKILLRTKKSEDDRRSEDGYILGLDDRPTDNQRNKLMFRGKSEDE